MGKPHLKVQGEMDLQGSAILNIKNSEVNWSWNTITLHHISKML